MSGSMWLMVAAPYARPASPGRRAGCPAAPFCKVAALPGGVARLAEQNLLQAERRLDDGASHEAAIVRPRLWMRHMSSMLTLRVMHRLAEGLVALRRFTGEVAALPGGVARLAKQQLCRHCNVSQSHGIDVDCRSYSLIGQLPIYPKEEDGNEAGIEEKMSVPRIQPPNMGA